MTSFLLLAGMTAVAAPAANSPLAKMGVGSSGSTLSLPMEIAISLTLLTLLPAAVMCITPFLRITVVLHFLRQALGTQSTPSNQVLIGLALFLTIVIVQPMAEDIYHKAWEPMDQGKMTASQAFDEGSKPLKTFLARFAREKDIKLFVEITKAPPPQERRGSEPVGSDSVLHPLRAENRIPDRRAAVSAVSGDRSGGGFGDLVHRHGPVAARDDFRARSRSCCSCWSTAGIWWWGRW